MAAGPTKPSPETSSGHSAQPVLVSAERGDLQNEFIEISEAEASQIVERIRATVTNANNS